jgi:hypothetical protein
MEREKSPGLSFLGGAILSTGSGIGERKID